MDYLLIPPPGKWRCFHGGLIFLKNDPKKTVNPRFLTKEVFEEKDNYGIALCPNMQGDSPDPCQTIKVTDGWLEDVCIDGEHPLLSVMQARTTTSRRVEFPLIPPTQPPAPFHPCVAERHDLTDAPAHNAVATAHDDLATDSLTIVISAKIDNDCRHLYRNGYVYITIVQELEGEEYSEPERFCIVVPENGQPRKLHTSLKAVDGPLWISACRAPLGNAIDDLMVSASPSPFVVVPKDKWGANITPSEVGRPDSWKYCVEDVSGVKAALLKKINGTADSVQTPCLVRVPVKFEAAANVTITLEPRYPLLLKLSLLCEQLESAVKNYEVFQQKIHPRLILARTIREFQTNQHRTKHSQEAVDSVIYRVKENNADEDYEAAMLRGPLAYSHRGQEKPLLDVFLVSYENREMAEREAIVSLVNRIRAVRPRDIKDAITAFSKNNPYRLDMWQWEPPAELPDETERRVYEDLSALWCLALHDTPQVHLSRALCCLHKALIITGMDYLDAASSLPGILASNPGAINETTWIEENKWILLPREADSPDTLHDSLARIATISTLGGKLADAAEEMGAFAWIGQSYQVLMNLGSDDWREKLSTYLKNLDFKILDKETRKLSSLKLAKLALKEAHTAQKFRSPMMLALFMMKLGSRASELGTDPNQWEEEFNKEDLKDVFDAARELVTLTKAYNTNDFSQVINVNGILTLEEIESYSKNVRWLSRAGTFLGVAGNLLNVAINRDNFVENIKNGYEVRAALFASLMLTALIDVCLLLVGAASLPLLVYEFSVGLVLLILGPPYSGLEEQLKAIVETTEFGKVGAAAVIQRLRSYDREQKETWEKRYLELNGSFSDDAVRILPSLLAISTLASISFSRKGCEDGVCLSFVLGLIQYKEIRFTVSYGGSEKFDGCLLTDGCIKGDSFVRTWALTINRSLEAGANKAAEVLLLSGVNDSEKSEIGKFKFTEGNEWKIDSHDAVNPNSQLTRGPLAAKDHFGSQSYLDARTRLDIVFSSVPSNAEALLTAQCGGVNSLKIPLLPNSPNPYMSLPPSFDRWRPKL